jgi:hypothetical protein
MAHNQDLTLSRYWLELVQGRQDKDRGLTKTRLGLAEDVDIENSSGDTDLLNCSEASGMLDLVRSTKV